MDRAGSAEGRGADEPKGWDEPGVVVEGLDQASCGAHAKVLAMEGIAVAEQGGLPKIGGPRSRNDTVTTSAGRNTSKRRSVACAPQGCGRGHARSDLERAQLLPHSTRRSLLAEATRSNVSVEHR
jgi:hypothetical protein